MIIRPRRLTPGYFRLLQVRGSWGWEGAQGDPKILPMWPEGHRAVLGPILPHGEPRALPARLWSSGGPCNPIHVADRPWGCTRSYPGPKQAVRGDGVTQMAHRVPAGCNAGAQAM